METLKVHETTNQDEEKWTVIEEVDGVHVRPIINDEVIETPVEREEEVDEVFDLGVEPEEIIEEVE